mgnify:CR=1 FL=1
MELLKEYNIPVWVMEPLRGGRLAKLGESHTQRLNALRPDEATPAWAFRFLQTIPEVTMILSGMSNMAQLQDNVHTFETEKPLTEGELDVIPVGLQEAAHHRHAAMGGKAQAPDAAVGLLGGEVGVDAVLGIPPGG